MHSRFPGFAHFSVLAMASVRDGFLSDQPEENSSEIPMEIIPQFC
jgi:hypothetical protein